ncbi:MAG: DNA repair protein RadC [Acutalibacteraceae bacterium]|nr:DNA repair protein RadC [Acutalibacteraceae bacterium]
MSENIHAGHRSRLKEQIISLAPGEDIQDEKLLEMLLFYGIPRQDTVPIARELMSRFGSLSGVLDADIDDLLTVKGMTRNAASLIKLQRPLSRAYILSKFGDKQTLKSLEEIGEFVLTKYFAVKGECFYLLCLNRLGRIISFEKLMSGNIDSVGVSVRTVLERVLKTEATAVVLAHNHPGGVAIPSPQDLLTTEQIAKALSTVSVNLIDHIIVADDDYISMAQSAKFAHIFGNNL